MVKFENFWIYECITELSNFDIILEQFSNLKTKWNHTNIELPDNANPTQITQSKAKLKLKKSKGCENKR